MKLIVAETMVKTDVAKCISTSVMLWPVPLCKQSSRPDPNMAQRKHGAPEQLESVT